ncbi:PKD domain-containing protein [Chloroflexi bacterium TSY]|nr:PKD domain-containing protein [Chloroflexi bacterium TSY]
MNVIKIEQTNTTPPGIREVAITALNAHNDGPTTFGHATWLYATVGTGSNVRYEWDCGDGYTAHGASIRHAYRQPGEYMATVIARNATSVMTATTFVIVGYSKPWRDPAFESYRVPRSSQKIGESRHEISQNTKLRFNAAKQLTLRCKY